MKTTTLTEPNTAHIKALVEKQRNYFATGATKDLKFRKEMLKKLKNAISNNEQAITEALHKDLRKH